MGISLTDQMEFSSPAAYRVLNESIRRSKQMAFWLALIIVIEMAFLVPMFIILARS